MKKSHLLIITLFIGLTLLMSACATGPRVTDAPGVAIDDTNVFVAYSSYVFSLDAAGGKVNWAYPEKGTAAVIFYAPPLVTDDAIYIGDLANTFHKLDKATGSEVWAYSDSQGFYLGQAAIYNGVVYAPNNDGILYALDADNGSLIWTFETGHYLWSQPVIANDTIYVGSMDHSVYAISLDGDKVWSYELSGAVSGAPIMSEDGSMVFAGSLGNQMVALDATTGDLVWSFDTAKSVWGTSVVADGKLVFTDTAGNIYIVSAEDGVGIWQTEIAGEIVGGATSIGDGFVVATQDGQIKAYDFDGGALWQDTIDGEVYQAPVANSDFLVTGMYKGDNLVVGYNLAGVQLWSTTPEK